VVAWIEEWGRLTARVGDKFDLLTVVVTSICTFSKVHQITVLMWLFYVSYASIMLISFKNTTQTYHKENNC
jgi:hypothetical protein